MFGSSNTNVMPLPESQVLAHRYLLFSLLVTGWINGQYLGLMDSTWVEEFRFGCCCVVNWGLVVWVQGSRWESLGGCKIFAEACDLNSLGTIPWVVVLLWVRVCDYSYGQSVCYQQKLFSCEDTFFY